MNNSVPIVLATGRDGSLSTAKALEHIVKDAHLEFQVLHEYKHLDIYDAICSNSMDVYQEIATYFFEDIKRNRIIPVGAGYSLLMPFLSDAVLSNLRILMLRRPFESWVSSMRMVSEKWAHNSGNYLLNEIKSEIKHYRPSAVNFGEMQETDWNLLSLDDKLKWYYEKQISSAESIRNRVEFYTLLKTDLISTDEGVSKYCEFLQCDFKNNYIPAHLNSASVVNHPDINVARFLKEFDPSKAAYDLKYLTEFCLNKVEIGYINRQNFEHSQVSQKDLIAICLVIENYLNKFRAFN